MRCLLSWVLRHRSINGTCCLSIVDLNMPVASSVACRYHARGVDADDLQQVAYVGLIKAVSRFDYTLEHDFLSYAAPTITGEVRRYFCDSCWAVRFPRRIQELQGQIPPARERLTQDLCRRPTLTDIAEALGVSAEDIAEAMAATGCFTPALLDQPDSTGVRSAIGQIVDHRLKGLARSADHVFVTQLLQGLSDRDRVILRYRYVDGLTQHQIAQRVGVTQMQVSRVGVRPTSAASCDPTPRTGPLVLKFVHWWVYSVA